MNRRFFLKSGVFIPLFLVPSFSKEKSAFSILEIAAHQIIGVQVIDHSAFKDNLVQIIKALHPEDYSELDTVFSLAKYAPISLLLFAKWNPPQKWKDQDWKEALIHLSESSFFEKRYLYQVIKGLVHSAYYQLPESKKVTGYPGAAFHG